MRTAILVDGGFYRRRAQQLWGEKTAEQRADELNLYCKNHLKYFYGKFDNDDLYRIFYYDCPPMDKKIYNPYLKRTVDYGKSELYVWMNAFLEQLKSKRKFAIRFGKLSDSQAHFTLHYDVLKKLCNGTMDFSEVQESDFSLQVDQKGVDMKIGLDIASLAYKKQVGRIILISGDSDFVPAAKLARREGIDFILDPLGATIKPELNEHIDGLKSHIKYIKKITGQIENEK